MTYAVEAVMVVVVVWAFAVAASDAIRERRGRRVAREAADARERWRREQQHLKVRRLDEFACWRRFKARAPEPSSSDGE